MAGPLLHFVLAGQVLERWQRAPAAAACELTPAARNAFLHGALGPDMGYFPGADAWLSELPHRARSGTLCRALVAGARSEAELAYAWGWVTHVLADVAIHPLVNEACGELRLGRRVALWGREALSAHLAVEGGLDALYARRAARVLPFPLRPALGRHGLEFIRRAYRVTYGRTPAHAALLRAHAAVTRLAAPLAALRRCAALTLVEEAPLQRVLGAGACLPLRLGALLSPPRSAARALFTPLQPAPWLADEVRDVVTGFADWFDAHYRSGLRFLRDHCLDTGQAAPEGERSESAPRVGAQRARYTASGGATSTPW